MGRQAPTGPRTRPDAPRRSPAILAAALATVSAALLLGGFTASSAEASKRKLNPVRHQPRSLAFVTRDLDPAAVHKARLVMRHARKGRVTRRVTTHRVRGAVTRGSVLRLGVSRGVRHASLHVGLRAEGETPPPDTDPPAEIVARDNCNNPNFFPVWGEMAAQSDSRHLWHSSGGPQGGPYREYVVRDGDNALGAYGERTEVGYNNQDDTFALYEEGDRLITDFWVRLPDRSLVDSNKWIIFMQQKQTQPNPDGGGSPVIALLAAAGEWRLRMTNAPGGSDNSQVWSAPAETGTWVHGFTDVTYSDDPSKGKIQVGIGDTVSPVITHHTLKRDRYGDAIPGHLRMGLYRDDEISNTSKIEIGQVQVYEPAG